MAPAVSKDDRAPSARARGAAYAAASSVVVWLITGYLYMLVAQPHLRFRILETLRFERVWVIASWVLVFATGRLRPRINAASVLIVTLFLWMYLSFLVSDYGWFYYVRLWRKEYWKLIVFYLLILFAVNRARDLHGVMCGFVGVVFFYQLHSWSDFVRGGSYVWQQGMKRMVGVWTSGIGAANAYAMIVLLTVPFAVYWLRRTESKWVRAAMVFYLVMTFGSIMVSGTRAAFVCLVAYVGIVGLKNIRNVKVGISMAIAVVALLVFMPPEVKHRFLNLIFSSDDSPRSQYDRVAMGSAEGRIEGLLDGFELATMSPVLGHGPGSSAAARRDLIKGMDAELEGWSLQLHNLYGQIVSEIGFGGALLFAALMAVYFASLLRARATIRRHGDDPEDPLEPFFDPISEMMLILLMYGMFSHTLYRYYWFVALGCHGALIELVRDRYAARRVRPRAAVAPAAPRAVPATSLGRARRP